MKVHVKVTDRPLDEADAVQWLDDHGASGARVHFCGQVRDEQGQVQALELEHYPGMTERVMRTIAEQADEKWPLNGAWLVHRVGRIEVGEPIVVVAVSAAHRQAAFAACAFIMDLLKTRVPFWKRELIDGVWHWVDAREEDAAAAEAWLRSSTGREP